jgi:hypothetical protein
MHCTKKSLPGQPPDTEGVIFCSAVPRCDEYSLGKPRREAGPATRKTKQVLPHRFFNHPYHLVKA